MSMWEEYMKEKKTEIINETPHDTLKLAFGMEVNLDPYTFEMVGLYRENDKVTVTYRLKDFKI